MCRGARNRAAIWPASCPASEMWATPQRINAPFRFKKGQHRNLVFSWKQNWAVSEVQWARVTLSFPRPPVLFAYLFSSFLCFGTPGIVGSSRVRKQHCQNILRKEDCELFLAQAGAGSIWHLRVPGKFFLMRIELHTEGAQGFGETPDGQTQRELPCGLTEVTLPGVTLEKVSAHLLDTATALRWLLGACSFWEPPPLLLLPTQALHLGLFFFPSDKEHTDGALSATIKGLRWVMGNGRTWHVLVCLSAISP